MAKKINSKLSIKASASVQDEIDKELSRPDPSSEKAKAFLQKEKDKDENTPGDD